MSACDTGGAASPAAATPPPAVTPYAFKSDPPSVYVAKVKDILVGLPPTAGEVAQVTADPTALGTLVDQWMMLPEYTAKMTVFFELAFQQTQINNADFADQVFPDPGAGTNPATIPLLLQNAEESFARTVLALVAAGKPLTEAVTTQSFMMTPALMELYAFLDAWQVDDAGTVTDRFAQAHPGLSIDAEAAAGPIDITETLDPTSPNYMHWYDPDVANSATQGPNCYSDPIVYAANATDLHYIVHGSLRVRKNAMGGLCGGSGGTLKTSQLQPSDFTTWKMVTVRAPQTGEAPTNFYDLPTLRSATTLVAQVPRVGFFSTPAFFANWQTNTSNEMRVTVNQSLIVALGAQVDGSDPTTPSTTPGLDAVHAAPGSACFGCHQTLDPTRSILAATYSWNYHNQTEQAYATQKGLFAFQSVIKPVATVNDFATILATHPLFAQAWVQKLCFYVNSGACETTDPEFQRIVQAFVSSNYSWSTLVHRDRHLAAHHARGADPDDERPRRDHRGGSPGSPVRRDQRPARLRRHLRPRRLRPNGLHRRPADRGRPTFRRLRPRRDRAGAPQHPDPLLPRGDGEHLRGHRAAGD